MHAETEKNVEDTNMHLLPSKNEKEWKMRKKERKKKKYN
jgi:hypothetical protein